MNGTDVRGQTIHQIAPPWRRETVINGQIAVTKVKLRLAGKAFADTANELCELLISYHDIVLSVARILKA